MKYFSFAFVAVGLLCTAFIGKQKSDRQEFGLKGKVKSFVEIRYHTDKDGNIIMQGERPYLGPDLSFKRDPKMNYAVYFNESGNIMEMDLFSPWPIPWKKTTYKYNAKEYLTERLQTEVWNEKQDTGSCEKISYDRKGRVKKEWDYMDGSLLRTYKYRRRKGLIRQKSYYEESGSFVPGSTSVYDKKGRVVQRELYTESGEILSGKTQWKYFGDSLIAEYDHCFASWCCSPARPKVDGHCVDTLLFRYNKNGDVIEAIEKNKRTWKFVYVYDDHHNWVRKTVFSVNDMVGAIIFERRIKYYE